MFDGSSIAGWKGINESDMILMPDPSTAMIDPFFEETTLLLRCDIVEPTTMQGYSRDPRSLGKRAEAYLKSTGIAESACSGPRTNSSSSTARAGRTKCMAAATASIPCRARGTPARRYDGGNMGHRPGVKGGYFPVPPVDRFQDLRTAMCQACEELGLKVEVHHHEVGTGGQGEINVSARTR